MLPLGSLSLSIARQSSRRIVGGLCSFLTNAASVKEKSLKMAICSDSFLIYRINLFTMSDQEYGKAKVFIIVEIIEYIPNSVVIKTIIKKTTGNVSAVSFDSGETLAEKTSPFDSFIQVIDGNAEVVIDDKSSLLATGDSIIIPAHTRNTIKANERFKMISTVIKSGYE